VISFNLAAAARVIRFSKDEFDAVFFGFSFEQLRDELFPIIEINLSWDPTFSESPLESVDGRNSIFVKIDFAFHAVAGTIIGESGDIDLSDTTNSKLERIPLPHAVDMSPLKPFTRRLWFGLDPNEKSIFLEDTMCCSPGTEKIELVLDSSGSPCRIFPFEPNDTLFQ
jgi:hypothetical protein